MSCVVHAQDTTTLLTPSWTLPAAKHTILIADSGRKVLLSDDGKNITAHRATDGVLIDSIKLDTTYSQLIVSGDGSALFGLVKLEKHIHIDSYSTSTWSQIRPRMTIPAVDCLGVLPLYSDSVIVSVVFNGTKSGKYVKLDNVIRWYNLNTGFMDARAGCGKLNGPIEYGINPMLKAITLPTYYRQDLEDHKVYTLDQHLKITENPREFVSIHHTEGPAGHNFFQYDRTFSRVLTDNRYRFLETGMSDVNIEDRGQWATSPLPDWTRCIRWYQTDTAFDVVDAWTNERLAKSALQNDTVSWIVQNPWDAKVIFISKQRNLYCYDLQEYQSGIQPYTCSIGGLSDTAIALQVVKPYYKGRRKVGQVIKWFVDNVYQRTGEMTDVQFTKRGIVEIKCELFADSLASVPLCSVTNSVFVKWPDQLLYCTQMHANALAIFAPRIDVDFAVYCANGTFAYRVDTSNAGSMKSTWSLPRMGIASTDHDEMYLVIRDTIIPPIDSLRYLTLDRSWRGIIDTVGIKLKLPKIFSTEYLHLETAFGRFHPPTGRTT